jgi:tetratricopeptide (TPR) repeat protein
VRRTLLFLLLTLPSLAGTTLVAEVNSPTGGIAGQFDAANKLYEERKFPEAAAAYDAILTNGAASPAVYFNLGNARFKSGEIGRAIVAYRRAAQLTPRDPDIKANLQFARNQVQGPTLRPSRLQRAFGLLSLNEWTGLTSGALWLTFLLLAVMQVRPALRASLRTVTLITGGATMVLAICLFADVQLNASRDRVVVTARDVLIRNGPLDESQTSFTANDGAELRVLDRKDDWLQVTDGTRRVGWLKRGEVGTL